MALSQNSGGYTNTNQQSSGGGSSGGTSAARSYAVSTPQLMQSPQSQFSLQLSQLLGNLGQNQYNWAQREFGNTNNVSDAAINNYIRSANYAGRQGGSLWNQYAQTYQPMMNQYAQMASNYASPGRIQQQMGSAESNASQAAQQNIDNTTQTLQSYGIDPSSGRYGELEQAANSAKAASEAGAGQQAQLATEQTAHGLQQNAIGMGQQIPGQSVNALNAAYQGVAGAENANLGQGNLGTSLTTSANPYFATAQGVKLPGIGNSSVSGSSSNSQQSAQNSFSSTGTGHSQNSGSAYSGPSQGGYGAGYTNNSSGGQPVNSGGYASGGYARGGGVIPSHATTGGFVPKSASPSAGAVTDDIPARLNADEFVIPRDVTHWLGQGYFQKLIKQARKEQAQARQHGAQGEMKPPLPGPPSFVSHHMGAG